MLAAAGVVTDGNVNAAGFPSQGFSRRFESVEASVGGSNHG